MNGDTESGVTTFLLKQEIDTGNILFSEKISINKDQTVGELHDELMGIGAKLVIKTVDALADGTAIPISQDKLEIEPERLHAPKIFKEDCRINWHLEAEKNHNKVRGLSPYPTAWTELSAPAKENIPLKIFRTAFEKCVHPHEPGTIISDQKKWAKIACANGYLLPTDLQLAGKKRMGIEEFLRGFPRIDSYKAV
jgi:methionyl-tRNA formyltransferase